MEPLPHGLPVASITVVVPVLGANLTNAAQDDISSLLTCTVPEKLGELQHLRFVRWIVVGVRNQHPTRAGCQQSTVFHGSYL